MAGTRGILLAGIGVAALAAPGFAAGATIEVTTKADELDVVADAKCSLREAVDAANDDEPIGGCGGGDPAPAVDTIVLKDRTYALSIPTTNEGGNQNGDLDISEFGGPVVIRGEGRKVTTVEIDQNDRAFDFIGDDTDAALSDLAVDGGNVTSFGTGTGRGGAVDASEGGALALTRVGVTDGVAYVGGGVYIAQEGTLTIKRSTLNGNGATGLGGGVDAIAVGGELIVKISKSTVRQNNVTSLTENSAAGGISNRATAMTISDSSILQNTAIASANEHASAAGISNSQSSSLTVRRSLFAQNTAFAPTAGFTEHGGGLWTGGNPGETVTVTNSTFFDNAAGASDGDGGAVYVHSGDVHLDHVTFAQNSAPDGTNVYASAGLTQLRNSILEGSDPCTGDDPDIQSLGFNVAQETDPDCDFVFGDVTDVITFGFKTGIPEDNGGQTKTIALKKSSPAVNLVPKADCASAEGTDQRRFKRPALGKRCDSGSFERGATP